MANLDSAATTEGTSRFGSNAAGTKPGIEVAAPTTHDRPSYFALESTSAGGVKTVYYYWPNSTGVLRFGTTRPGDAGFDQDTSGTAV